MSAASVRRFYTSATVAEDGAGVMLDARRLRTPAGAPFAAPTRALAAAIAQEWDAQQEYIVPARMPLTQLAFAAIDHAPRRRDELAAYVAKFGETDLVCHRAAAPAPLVLRQAAAWDPLIGWASQDLGVMLPVVSDVAPGPVRPESLETLRAHAAALDDFALTALAQAAGLSGSALAAFALLRGKLDAQQAFEVAALDDLWSLENWGEDAEARARLETQRVELINLGRFIAALAG